MSLNYDSRISDTTGVAFTRESKWENGNYIVEFRPIKPEYPYGFLVRMEFYWQRFVIKFVPDSYARNLIEAMASNLKSRKIFRALVSSFNESSTTIAMEINGEKINPRSPKGWGKEWSQLSIELEKYTDAIDKSEIKSIEPLIYDFGSRFTSMILSLMPLEEIGEPDEEDYHVSGLPEGMKSRIVVNKYERNKINRLASISHHGCYCQVCGFDFKKIYGELGENFIEVHHVTPVSKMAKKNYAIDPIKDLIPLCPNCHAMIHKRNPSLSIKDLKQTIENNQ